MVEIILDFTRTMNVLHQVDTILFQRPVNSPENIQGPGLIVYCIKGRDQIKLFAAFFLINVSDIFCQKTDIVQSFLNCFVSRNPWSTSNLRLTKTCDR